MIKLQSTTKVQSADTPNIAVVKDMLKEIKCMVDDMFEDGYMHDNIAADPKCIEELAKIRDRIVDFYEGLL